MYPIEKIVSINHSNLINNLTYGSFKNLSKSVINHLKEAPYSFFKSIKNTRFKSKILYIDVLLEEWN